MQSGVLAKGANVRRGATDPLRQRGRSRGVLVEARGTVPWGFGDAASSRVMCAKVIAGQSLN